MRHAVSEARARRRGIDDFRDAVHDSAGVQMITSSTPATRAGIAAISSDEGNGAVPPGT